ncbi:Ltp family lipoprotein [Clavibacter zhangzhiyongii]|uniref:Ltp family lipoprotein n=1 Tax=Clavibacter zhangzhiyongii TaxID=2768071 RepID=UPI00195ECA42|nr:Ltp family lipoprotein [Clavibacter zhangzhiyongii]
MPAESATALIKADTYANGLDMSKAGLYEQLTSEYGERFTPEEADHAITHLDD